MSVQTCAQLSMSKFRISFITHHVHQIIRSRDVREECAHSRRMWVPPFLSALVNHSITLAGILLVEFKLVASDEPRPNLEVEIHVRAGLESATLTHSPSTRVTQIVIRVDTLNWSADASVDVDQVPSIEEPMTTLPQLQTVTLETALEEESAELVQMLPTLNRRGQLERRTCKQAQSIAQEARNSLVGYAEEQGTISPLWYSDEYSDHERNRWCATFRAP